MLYSWPIDYCLLFVHWYYLLVAVVLRYWVKGSNELNACKYLVVLCCNLSASWAVFVITFCNYTSLGWQLSVLCMRHTAAIAFVTCCCVLPRLHIFIIRTDNMASQCDVTSLCLCQSLQFLSRPFYCSRSDAVTTDFPLAVCDWLCVTVQPFLTVPVTC